jgi:hypothetical protein
MASITAGLTVNFKKSILQGIHVFGVDTFKLALYLPTANIGPGLNSYVTFGETSGTGYTAGGLALSNPVIQSDGKSAFLNFDNLTFPTTSITARAALIYNASKSNLSVCVLDFGQTFQTSGGDFVVRFQTPIVPNAVIQIL